MKSFALICLLLVTTLASAQQPTPALSVPTASTPAMAAFLRWHQSLTRKDFAAYKSVVFTIPEMTESMQKQMFDQLVTNTPAVVKIGDQKTNPNGSVSFTAVGCVDNRRLVNDHGGKCRRELACRCLGLGPALECHSDDVPDLESGPC